MSKYDEVLKPFVSLMERELHANSGKGDRPGWLSMSAYDCMLEIYYHAAKLQKAIKDSNGDGIAEYSADVANMAMMVADICGAIHLAAPVVERQEPFMYGIMQPDGKPHYSELCVSGEASDLESEVESMNDGEDAGYRVVALYAEQPAPVAHHEPVAYMRNEGTPNNLVKCTFTCPGAFGVYRKPPAPVAVVMSFEFEHPLSKEMRTVTLTKQDVYDGMEDYFYDKLGEQICQCESVGETNVVDCNCDEYVHDFEMVADKACRDKVKELNQ